MEGLYEERGLFGRHAAAAAAAAVAETAVALPFDAAKVVVQVEDPSFPVVIY